MRLSHITSMVHDSPNLARMAISGGIVLLIGCTAASQSDRSYAHVTSEPPLIISWNYVRSPGIVVAEGIARNDLPRKFQFLDVRTSLVGLDKADRVVRRSVTRVPDFVGPETRFRVELKLSGSMRSTSDSSTGPKTSRPMAGGDRRGDEGSPRNRGGRKGGGKRRRIADVISQRTPHPEESEPCE